jgi:hypothetical protein
MKAINNTSDARIFIDAIGREMNDSLQKFDRAELELIISTCKRLTDTNCSWISYAVRDAVQNLAKNRLRIITPISQQNKK